MGVREAGWGTPRAFCASSCLLVVPEEDSVMILASTNFIFGSTSNFKVTFLEEKKGKKNQVFCNNLISTYLRRFPQREE